MLLAAVLLALAANPAAGGPAHALRLTSARERGQQEASLDGALYVKPGASGGCSSWLDACELQTALGMAVSGDQVWVMTGVYTPGPAGDRLATFQLQSGVTLYGGFPDGQPAFEERDWEAYPTTLSGDIDGMAGGSGNAYRVVSAVGITETATLDGLIITGGYNDAPTTPEQWGGGLYSENSDLAIQYVRFEGNTAAAGGGMFINGGLQPVSLEQVEFVDNTAITDGGGLHLYDGGSPTLREITFDGNIAYSRGGGIASHNSNPILTNAAFSANSAQWGGGMYNDASSPNLTNVTISGNIALSMGGGMYNSGSSPYLVNVTLSGNSANSTGGMVNEDFSSPALTNVTIFGNAGGGMVSIDNSYPTLTNAILWGNTPGQIGGSVSSVTYSAIQGGYTGEGNIDQDPLLGPLADNGGFTRTHALGGGSPAIDAGSPGTCPARDQRGQLRPADGDLDGAAVCDMGAYEFAPLRLYLPMAPK